MKVNLAQGWATGQGHDRLIRIDDAVGSRFGDVLRGNRYGNRLVGMRGDDIMRGAKANDVFFPARGDDKIFGGRGRGDWVWFISFDQRVIANLSTGTSRGEGSDTMTGVEALSGSERNDTLIGDGQNNALFGAGGDDTLRGPRRR